MQHQSIFKIAAIVDDDISIWEDESVKKNRTTVITDTISYRLRSTHQQTKRLKTKCLESKMSKVQNGCLPTCKRNIFIYLAVIKWYKVAMV